MTAGVTIAVPNWNHEIFLPRSISTALEAVRDLRSYDIPAEVIVVDDNSRDGSFPLLRQLEALYFQDGLRVLALRENGGICHARNQAMAHARYRHVLMLDADNEVIPRNVRHFHESLIAADAAVVYGNLLVKEENRVVHVVSNESFQSKIFHENYVDALAMFDRERVLEVTSGYSSDRRISAHGDWDLYLSLAASGSRIVFVPMVLGIYHRIPGSMLQDSPDCHRVERALIKRTYNQTGIRGSLPLNTGRLRFHPALGFC